MPSGNSTQLEAQDIGGEYQKSLSSSLFAQIKPICVSLSQLTLLPSSVFRSDSERLIRTLVDLNTALNDHEKLNTQQGEFYSLLPNLADYVFFPISNLLKQSQLNDKVIEQVLDIISFLIRNSWTPNGQLNEKLLDQLLPVILYLIKGASNDIDAVIEHKSFNFKVSVSRILLAVIQGGQNEYFCTDDVKRLSMLGDISSTLLSMLKYGTANIASPEIHEFLTSLLSTMKLLFVESISSEQLTRIFPGVTSALVNFVTQSKNLHFTILAWVIDLLRLCIVKVFSDDTLSVEVRQGDDNGHSIDGLYSIWEASKDVSVDTSTVSANVNVLANQDHLNNSWLKATSKKLKISLTAFFKTIFLDANKSKVSTKSKLAESILLFVKNTFQHCFWSLFNELFALNIDILALLCYCQCFPNSGPLDQDSQINILNEMILYLGPSLAAYVNSSAARKLLRFKLEDLIDNKMALIMTSAAEEKMLQLLTSLKLHFLLLQKHKDGSLDLINLVQKQILSLNELLYESFTSRDLKKVGDGKTNSSTPPSSYGDVQQSDQSDNKFDDVELPPYVNANNVTKFRKKSNNKPTKSEFSSDLLLLGNLWSVSEWTGVTSLKYFDDNFSYLIEEQLENYLMFLSRLPGVETRNKLEILESLLLSNDSQSPRDLGASLWIANQFLGKHRETSHEINIEEFIDFGEDDDESSESNCLQEDEMVEDINYLVVSQSQNLMEKISPHLDDLSIMTVSLSRNEIQRNQVNEKAYSVALDSIGFLSYHLPKEEFKESFLIDFLFPIFEALTFNSNPRIQSHARNVVLSIAKNHYRNSIADLIIENLDYLVDSLSLKLTVPGSITPALLGILIVILEASGLKLLLTNQLTDLISQIFVLIDSYHGYSVLVEGFFIFFARLVKKIKAEYLKETDLKKILFHASLYKPWGMTSMDQVKALVNETGKLYEPFENYEREKEYFHRKQDAFSEADSDDEEKKDSDDEQDEEREEKETEGPWPSPVPKAIYFIVQRIFIYGLRLLSHPSDSLKVQLLNTLIEVYPILSTNYSLVLPLVAQNWDDIIALLPSDNSDQDISSDTVSITTVELLTLMLETDRFMNDTFLSKRFTDLWNMIHEKFKSDRTSSLEIIKVTSFKKTTNVKLLKALLKYLVTGLNNYERIIPDVTALHIMKFVAILGVPDIELGKQARNILWVITH